MANEHNEAVTHVPGEGERMSPTKVQFTETAETEQEDGESVEMHEPRWRRLFDAFKPMFQSHDAASGKDKGKRRRQTYNPNSVVTEDRASINSAQSVPVANATLQAQSSSKSPPVLTVSRQASVKSKDAVKLQRRKSMGEMETQRGKHSRSVSHSIANESLKAKERLKDIMARIKSLKLPSGLMSRKSARKVSAK